jgi:hypothetical protein
MTTVVAVQGDPLGELSCSPKAQYFCTLFLLVPTKQMVCVAKWPNPEYDPREIYKLCINTAFDDVDNTFDSEMTPAGLVFCRWVSKKENYKTPTVWSTAFLLWSAIQVVYLKDLDLFLKLYCFYTKIRCLLATYV